MIVSSENVLWGAPRINNTRISVYDVISSLWYNPDIEDFVLDFRVDKESVKTALEYCKELKCRKEKALNFCDGCILRTAKDGETYIKKSNKILQIDDKVFENENKDIFIGEFTDLESEEAGFMGWVRADMLLEKLSF